jgi:hypothetical protein
MSDEDGFGAKTLQAVRDAIDQNNYGVAGRLALGGVITPMRLSAESLASVIEACNAPSELDVVIWHLQRATPALSDALCALSANVFAWGILPENRRQFVGIKKSIKIASPEHIERLSAAEVESRGLAYAITRCLHVAPLSAGEILDLFSAIGEVWRSVATAVDTGSATESTLTLFQRVAVDATPLIVERMTSLRVATRILRGY